jgi:hypothetical protein
VGAGRDPGAVGGNDLCGEDEDAVEGGDTEGGEGDVVDVESAGLGDGEEGEGMEQGKIAEGLGLAGMALAGEVEDLAPDFVAQGLLASRLREGDAGEVGSGIAGEEIGGGGEGVEAAEDG